MSYTTVGIDVSAHNGTFATEGQAFVFVRACYGSAKDTSFDAHFSRAKAAGVVTGAYCFGRFMDPEFQADRLLEIASAADFLFLDREADEGHPTMTTAQARRFIARIHAKGRKVGLYASESGYPADAFGADYRWVANYSREPRIPWQWWQYRGTGLDRSYFRGTVAELRALASPPASAATGGTVKFSTLYDPPKSVAAPKGTVLRDFTGAPLGDPLPADTHLTTYGLADAHSGQFVVEVNTAAFYADKVKRPSLAIAVIPGGTPE